MTPPLTDEEKRRCLAAAIVQLGITVLFLRHADVHEFDERLQEADHQAAEAQEGEEQ